MGSTEPQRPEPREIFEFHSTQKALQKDSKGMGRCGVYVNGRTWQHEGSQRGLPYVVGFQKLDQT